MDLTVQNRPRSNLAGLVTVSVWWNASGLEANRCAEIIRPGFWQDATGLLPVFHFQAWLQWSTCRRPRWYCEKPAWIRLSSGWLCQVLAKRIRSGSEPVSKNHPARFWPVLLSRSGLDANQIRHVEDPLIDRNRGSILSIVEVTSPIPDHCRWAAEGETRCCRPGRRHPDVRLLLICPPSHQPWSAPHLLTLPGTMVVAEMQNKKQYDAPFSFTKTVILLYNTQTC